MTEVSGQRTHARIVAIPVPYETYSIAKAEADKAGLPVGTKIRTDMISYYKGVARRSTRVHKKGSI